MARLLSPISMSLLQAAEETYPGLPDHGNHAYWRGPSDQWPPPAAPPAAAPPAAPMEPAGPEPGPPNEDPVDALPADAEPLSAGYVAGLDVLAEVLLGWLACRLRWVRRSCPRRPAHWVESDRCWCFRNGAELPEAAIEPLEPEVCAPATVANASAAAKPAIFNPVVIFIIEFFLIKVKPAALQKRRGCVRGRDLMQGAESEQSAQLPESSSFRTIC